MDIARQHLLTGARLAGNQHSGIALRHPSGQLQQLLAGGLIGYRPLTIGDRRLTEGMPSHQIEQGLGLEGFDQVIRCALAHGVDGPLHRTKSSHQQHRQLRVTLTHQSQQLMAIHARHIDVTDHQAKGFLCQSQQGRLRAIHRPIGMPTQLQGIGQRFTQGAVILNQQHFGNHDHYSWVTGWAAAISGRVRIAQVPRPGRERSSKSP